MPKKHALSDIETQALKEGDPSRRLEALRALLEGDSREGAKRLQAKFERRVSLEQREGKRLETLWAYEREAAEGGHRDIAGLDEAGRGPLAGPVVAAAVILHPDRPLPGVNDSKKLTEEKREALFPLIQERAVAVGVGAASAVEIDELNIYRAAQLAMERAVEALGVKPGYLLTDAMPLPKLSSIPQKPLAHGDALSASIAAASIVAKVTRDRWMKELHQKYPVYRFDAHKGYGTEVHLSALRQSGPCPEHRRSFAPVMEVLAGREPGGPFAYWRDKLKAAKDPKALHQVGLQIKRAALSHLSQGELESLRELFRGKRAQLG